MRCGCSYSTPSAPRFFANAGLADAYRVLHPDAVEHSWFGRSGLGYRFDHAFITTQHAGLIRSCRYLQKPRELALTDHAAMTLSLGPIRGRNPAGRSDAHG
jgi:exonuclease III